MCTAAPLRRPLSVLSQTQQNVGALSRAGERTGEQASVWPPTAENETQAKLSRPDIQRFNGNTASPRLEATMSCWELQHVEAGNEVQHWHDSPLSAHTATFEQHTSPPTASQMLAWPRFTLVRTSPSCFVPMKQTYSASLLFASI